MAGPYADLHQHDVEPGGVGVGVRLVRRTGGAVGARCHLALRTARGWYVARDPIGPCDPAHTELPGETEIIGLERRDVIGGGDPEVVVDVEIGSTRLSLHPDLSILVARRRLGATVVCSTRPLPPRCTPPIPYACASRAVEDAPLDLLRRERREPPVRAWLLALGFMPDGTRGLTRGRSSGPACDAMRPAGPIHLDL